MTTEAFYGIMLPFLGTSLGSACVLFVKSKPNRMLQRALTGFAAGAMIYLVVEKLIPEMSEGKALQRGNAVVCRRSYGYDSVPHGQLPKNGGKYSDIWNTGQRAAFKAKDIQQKARGVFPTFSYLSASQNM